MSAVTNAAIPGIEEIRTMGERNVIKAALLGAGTVGSGVYALAEMLKDEMFQKTGASLEIKKVLVRNTKKDRPGIPKEIMYHSLSFFEIRRRGGRCDSVSFYEIVGAADKF